MKKLNENQQAELVGKRWSEIPKDIKDVLLSGFSVVQMDWETMEELEVPEDGECALEFSEFISIKAEVKRSKNNSDVFVVSVDDNEKIYYNGLMFL